MTRNGFGSDFARVVDYLRQNPPSLTTGERLTIAEKMLTHSFAAYQRGDSTATREFVDLSCLQGFEPVEDRLPTAASLEFEQFCARCRECLAEHDALEQARDSVEAML